MTIAEDAAELSQDNIGNSSGGVWAINLGLGGGVVPKVEVGFVKNLDVIRRRIIDDNETNRFVVLGSRVVVGLISFDQISLEDDSGQIAIDWLENQCLGPRNEMGRFAVGFTAIFKVLAQPALEID